MRTISNQTLWYDAERTPSRRGISASRRRRDRFFALMVCVALLLVALLTLYAAPSTLATAAPTNVASQGDHWMLVLVNDSHPMEPYLPELTQLRNGQAVDARCYPDLQRMFDAARAEGLSPKINSSYRSREEQQQILDDAIAEGVWSGFSERDARLQALRTIAEPGTSEHETGLAVDVASEQQTWESDGAVHEWLTEHGWEYGWILRYPAGKEQITGIDNEPWHFRYVGTDAAREMHESGLCLEEYLGQE